MAENEWNRVVSFTEGAYKELITFLQTFETDLRTDYLRPDPRMTLDSTLGQVVRPGSHNWGLVKDIQERAKSFGNSVWTHFTKMADDSGDFGDVLTDGLGIFKTCSDLAAVDASTLLDQYPEFSSSGA